jgi:predicted DNA-binding WGR domain protein
MATPKRVNRKVLLYVGLNETLKHKFSSKIYVLSVSGRTLYRGFGPIDVVGYKASVLWLQEQAHDFASDAEARDGLQDLMDSKLRGGYEPMPRGFKVAYPKPKGGK